MTITELAPAPAPAPVFVCPPDHKHAEKLTCYHHHRCRCVPCVDAVNDYQARVRKLIAYGRWQPLVPATRARNHIRVLSAAGIGHRRVATLATLSAAHVADISAGITMRISPDAEARVLAIPVDASSFADGQLVPATGVIRRLQALGRMGWSHAALATELGMEPSNVGRLHNQIRVTVRTHEIITEAYERLWDVAPPQGDSWQRRTVAATLRRAEAAGWVPPLAWDDIDTDAAPPTPDEEDGIDTIAVALAVEGARVALTMDERREAVRQLHAVGHGDVLIAHMLCVSEKTIWKDRKHLGLPANEEPTPLTRERVA